MLPPVFPRLAPFMFIIFMIGSLDCLCVFWLVGATIGHFPVDPSLHFKARLSANSLRRCSAVHQNVRSRIFSQNCGRIFQSCRRTSHSTSEQGLEQFMSASNSKSTLHRTARLAIVWRISKYSLKSLVPKIWAAGSIYLRAICFWNSKSITHLNFERLLLHRFLWNLSGIFIISIKAREFQSKISANFFTRRDFL